MRLPLAWSSWASRTDRVATGAGTSLAAFRVNAPPDRAPNHARLIESQSELARLFQRIKSESLVALDTEAASFHRFRDRVYLIQVSSRQETAVVDPLAVTDLTPLGEILADPQIEIVFHDADYDLRLLAHEYGIRGTNLFDTRIAAQLLNEPGVGLAALLEKYFGIRLDKRYQRADWSARPLTPEMLDYAAADTRYLPELRDILNEQLRERGRLKWAEEEFSILSANPRTPVEAEEPPYLRLKGAKALGRRELAILRELVQWREELARRTDRAAFRILNNEPMLLMAKSPPRDLNALKAIRGIGQEQLERRGKDLLAAVERGLAIPESDLPRVDRTSRRPPDAAYEARLERLKAARNGLAERYQLAPGILCPNGTLEAIARINPSTLEQMSEIREMRRWQLREFGAALLNALQ
jgi:ribonuclease D